MPSVTQTTPSLSTDFEIGPADQERANITLPTQVFNECVDLVIEYKWLQKKKRSIRLGELWNECTSRAQQELLARLIRRFRVVTPEEISEACEAIHKQIVGHWAAKPLDTIFLACADNSQSDGSHPVLYFLKNHFENGWSEENFVSSLQKIKSKIKPNLFIVLIDDFTGSGTKATGRINYVRNEIERANVPGCRFAFATIASLEVGKTALDALEIPYYVHFWCKRGISDYGEAHVAASEIATMQEIEKALRPTWEQKSIETYSLGFKKSEALYYAEQWGIPNNVFPIFWWPFKSDITPLFRRTRPQ